MSGERGFTLLELLVSMTLLALIGVAAASSVRFGIAVWDRGGALAADAVEDRLVQKVLIRQVADARAILLRDGSRAPPVLFSGDRDRLEIVASLPGELAPPGDRLIAIELGNGEPRALRLRWVPVGRQRPVMDASARQEVLLDDVRSLRFVYFGPDPQGIRAWQPTWLGRSILPELVRITVERAGRPPWPPLIARLDAGSGQ